MGNKTKHFNLEEPVLIMSFNSNYCTELARLIKEQSSKISQNSQNSSDPEPHARSAKPGWRLSLMPPVPKQENSAD
jgi:hypothetical protein